MVTIVSPLFTAGNAAANAVYLTLLETGRDQYCRIVDDVSVRASQPSNTPPPGGLKCVVQVYSGALE